MLIARVIVKTLSRGQYHLGRSSSCTAWARMRVAQAPTMPCDRKSEDAAQIASYDQSPDRKIRKRWDVYALLDLTHVTQRRRPMVRLVSRQ